MAKNKQNQKRRANNAPNNTPNDHSSVPDNTQNENHNTRKGSMGPNTSR